MLIDTFCKQQVYPENRPEVVEEAIKRLKVDPDQVFCLYEAPENYDSKKHDTKVDFGKITRVTPNPGTVRQALFQYCELSGIPRKSLLKVFAAYAQDEKEKAKLVELSSTNPEPYNTFIKEEFRSVLETLQTFPSVDIPFDHFLEACPRLAPRYYSISSSPKENPRHVTVTSVVVEFVTKTGRNHKGVCSNWFLEQIPKKVVYCFPRKSIFKLPKKPETPIIMIVYILLYFYFIIDVLYSHLRFTYLCFIGAWNWIGTFSRILTRKEKRLPTKRNQSRHDIVFWVQKPPCRLYLRKRT